MTAPLTFVVPMPPNMANGRMHHMVKHRVKVGYWALLDWIAFREFDHAKLIWMPRHAAKIKGALKADLERLAAVNILDYPVQPAVPVPPLSRASIRSVMHLGAAMDEDNAMARHKFVLDWLTERGYLVDDRKKNIAWEGLPEQVVKRDGNYRIELTLTPLDAR